MSIMVKTMIQVLYIIICIAIVVVVLMQEGKIQGWVPFPVLQILTGARIRDVPQKVRW